MTKTIENQLIFVVWGIGMTIFTYFLIFYENEQNGAYFSIDLQ